jgi:multimeric flavodoxin WrbA
MKALILNGARDADPAITAVESSMIKLLRENGWEVEAIALREKNIAGCLGCFGCWVKTPGICAIDDYGREATKKIIQSNLMIWLTPVTFGGYSSELKKALDRSIPILLPYFESFKGQIHHKMRYDTYPKLVVIGTAPRNTEYEETFLALTERNVLNLRPPKHATGVFQKNENLDKTLPFVEDLLRKVEVIS